MADSPLDVARAVAASMDATSTALSRVTKVAMRQAGNTARRSLNRRATEVPGGDRRFSNMARYNHGGRLAVRVRSREGGTTTWVLSKGPWKLAEEGADPHLIGTWMHPGTRASQGRESWSRGREDAFADIGRKVPKQIGDAVEKAFGGS